MRPDYYYQLAQRALKNHSQIEKIQNKKSIDDDEGYATVSLISAMLFVIVMSNDWKMFDDLDGGKLYTYFDTSGFPNEVTKYCRNLDEFKNFITNLRNAVAHGDITLYADDKDFLIGVGFTFEYEKNGRKETPTIKFFEEDLKNFLVHLTNLFEKYSNGRAPVENL